MTHLSRIASWRGALAALAALLGAAVASPAAAASGDPFEPLNRGLFAIHGAFDKALGRPIAMTYRRVIPGPIRRALHNALTNLNEPGVAANDLLQLRVPAAGRSVARFAVNTTVGVAGVFDVATSMGLAHHDNGFGDTLGRAGLPPGPYLFIPIFGPSTVRDAIGDGVDFVFDPLTFVRHIRSRKLEKAEIVVGALDDRAKDDTDLNDLTATATDPYATLRSVYLQTTAARIRGEEAPLMLPELPPDTPASTAPPTAPAEIPPATPPKDDAADPAAGP